MRYRAVASAHVRLISVLPQIQLISFTYFGQLAAAYSCAHVLQHLHVCYAVEHAAYDLLLSVLPAGYAAMACTTNNNARLPCLPSKLPNNRPPPPNTCSVAVGRRGVSETLGRREPLLPNSGGRISGHDPARGPGHAAHTARQHRLCSVA